MKTRYEEIVDVSKIGTRSDSPLIDDWKSIAAKARNENFSPSANDPVRKLLLIIDGQLDFMPGGALEVPGANDDMERLTKFMYEKIGEISTIMCSLDTHSEYQIFHACWWADSEGNNPPDYTIIKYEDVKSGKWHPLVKPIESINYLKGLEAAGKKNLQIWPYHCLQGSTGAALERQLHRMIRFHSFTRHSVPIMIPKGQDPLTEMYGIIRPEYSPTNFVNTPVLNAFPKYEEIWIAGQAKSHCVLESGIQIAEYFWNKPDITERIKFLWDCSSCIPGCEADTEAAFKKLENQYGIQRINSTDI